MCSLHNKQSTAKCERLYISNKYPMRILFIACETLNAHA